VVATEQEEQGGSRLDLESGPSPVWPSKQIGPLLLLLLPDVVQVAVPCRAAVGAHPGVVCGHDDLHYV
jgi:hypothetical protein